MNSTDPARLSCSDQVRSVAGRGPRLRTLGPLHRLGQVPRLDDLVFGESHARPALPARLVARLARPLRAASAMPAAVEAEAGEDRIGLGVLEVLRRDAEHDLARP